MLHNKHVIEVMGWQNYFLVFIIKEVPDCSPMLVSNKNWSILMKIHWKEVGSLKAKFGF